MKKWFTIAAGIALLASFTQSCKKEGEQVDITLFDEINMGGYTYYVGTPGITAGVGNSPHGFERVRFNAIAQQALDANGKLPVGAEFPVGALIVKEIYESANGPINLYAVMKKDPASAVAGNGYEWAEFKPDGGVTFSTDKKGDGCISCHSASPNRDLIRTFDLH